MRPAGELVTVRRAPYSILYGPLERVNQAWVALTKVCVLTKLGLVNAGWFVNAQRAWLTKLQYLG